MGGFARSAYKAVVGQGWVSPSEFWSMAPGEFWWLCDAKNPPKDRDEYGQMLKLLKEARAE